MSNPFLDLQDRLVALLRLHPYYAPLEQDRILTEKIGDIDNKVARDLVPLGFGVVITTASGEFTSSLRNVTSDETLTVTLIHNPTLVPERNVLEALFAAIDAIQGKPRFAATVIRNESDVWKVLRHERRTDAPSDLHVHHLVVSAGLKLSGTPLASHA